MEITSDRCHSEICALIPTSKEFFVSILGMNRELGLCQSDRIIRFGIFSLMNL